MSKFKVGDVIVNTTSGMDSYWNESMPLFTRGVVTGLNGKMPHQTDWLLVEFDFPPYPQQVLPPSQFHEAELEAVVNSPLMKALR